MGRAGELYIRSIGHDDIEAVHRISGQLGLSRWSRSDLIEEVERTDSLTLLAVVDHDPVGFIIGRQVPGTDEGTFDAEIYNIGIVTQFHKKGIGSRLVHHFLEWAQANKLVNVWLEVRAANLSAISFYKRHVFEEIVTRKGFYSDPVDDAIIMRVEVSSYYNVLNKESLK